MTEEINDNFGSWAIVELMGHSRLAGYVTEVELFGSKIGRIDIPTSGSQLITQYFSSQSLFRLTPTTKAIAHRVALNSAPEPVHRWDLQLPSPEEDE